MAFTYGNSWQNRPDEGEGRGGSSFLYTPPYNKPFTPKIRLVDPETEFSVSFRLNGEEEVESFLWTLEEFEEEQIQVHSQFSLNSCEYYWADQISIDENLKTIVVNCSQGVLPY